MLYYIESFLGWLLSSFRGRDKGLFLKGPAFFSHPTATFSINAPECGDSNSAMLFEHSADSEGRIPEMTWENISCTADVVEYLLVIEDPDAPLTSPIVHGIYYGIPPSVKSVKPVDFEPAGGSSEKNVLRGGFKYGQNRKSNVWVPPRPVRCHGPHRYFFQLIALTEKIDPATLSQLATAEEVGREVVGKVAGWGQWIGVYERRLE